MSREQELAFIQSLGKFAMYSYSFQIHPLIADGWFVDNGVPNTKKGRETIYRDMDHVMVFALAEGRKLDDIFNMTPEERDALINRYDEFLEAHPIEDAQAPIWMPLIKRAQEQVLKEEIPDPSTMKNPLDKENAWRKLGVLHGITDFFGNAVRDFHYNEDLILDTYGSMDAYNQLGYLSGDGLRGATNILFAREENEMKRLVQNIRKNEEQINAFSDFISYGNNTFTRIFVAPNMDGLVPKGGFYVEDLATALTAREKARLASVSIQTFSGAFIKTYEGLGLKAGQYGCVEPENGIGEHVIDNQAEINDLFIQGKISEDPFYQLCKDKFDDVFSVNPECYSPQIMQFSENPVPTPVDTLQYDDDPTNAVDSRRLMKDYTGGSASDADREYAARMFDKSFQKYMQDENLQALMQETGLSIYDLIVVDGVSLADKAREKGLDLNSPDAATREAAEKAMKSYCMAAGLKPEADMAFIPLLRSGTGKILAGEPHPIVRDGQLRTPEVTGIKRLFKSNTRFRDNSVKFELTQSAKAKDRAVSRTQSGRSFGNLNRTLQEKNAPITQALIEDNILSQAKAKFEQLDTYVSQKLEQCVTSDQMKDIKFQYASSVQNIYAAMGDALRKAHHPILDGEKLFQKRMPSEVPANRPIQEQITELSNQIDVAESQFNIHKPETEEEIALANEILQKHVNEYMKTHNPKDFKNNREMITSMYQAITTDVKRECYFEHGLEVHPSKVLKEMHAKAAEKDKQVEALTSAKEALAKDEEVPQLKSKTTDDLVLQREDMRI